MSFTFVDNPTNMLSIARSETSRRVDDLFARGDGDYVLVRIETSQESTRVELIKSVPRTPLAMYADAAMKNVVLKRLEDATWFAEIPELEGVWASGKSPLECLRLLHDEVLLDWLLLKIEDQDRDIPVLEGIDLNVY